MGEQGGLGTRGSCGSKKRWFCGRKRAELLAVAGGLMCGSEEKNGKQMGAVAALGRKTLIKRQRIDPCTT